MTLTRRRIARLAVAFVVAVTAAAATGLPGTPARTLTPTPTPADGGD